MERLAEASPPAKQVRLLQWLSLLVCALPTIFMVACSL